MVIFIFMLCEFSYGCFSEIHRYFCALKFLLFEIRCLASEYERIKASKVQMVSVSVNKLLKIGLHKFSL